MKDNKCIKKWYGYKHNWSNWEKFETYQKSRANGQVVAEILVQEKKCKDCGFIKRNSKSYINF